MQVRELIEELKRFNEDAEVEVTYGWRGPGEISEVIKCSNRNVVNISAFADIGDIE